MSQKKMRPLDSIVNFESPKESTSLKSNEFRFEEVIRFEKLPIAGWHDDNQVMDSKCKQSCVKDCSCVSHCSWIVA